MKFSAFLFLVTFNLSCFCQTYWDVNFESNTWLSCLTIDTLNNPNNLWQVGPPQNTVINIAQSLPYCIITDTLYNYPVSDTSAFTITVTAGSGYIAHHTADITGWYWVNSDSLNDYGIIEYSPDQGNTWLEITSSSYDTLWNFPKPILTGNSGGWLPFYANLAGFGSTYSINYGDTIYFRFSFISDSTPDSLNGLAFDGIYLYDFAEGLGELRPSEFNSKVIPNPIHEKLKIEIDAEEKVKYRLIIYDSVGRIVVNQFNLLGNSITFDCSSFSKGNYYYQLIDDKNKRWSSNPFSIQ